MNCRKVRRLLSSYLDEETAAGERLAVASHLSRCPACKEVFTEMRRTRLLLLATPRLPVPEEFARGWRRRLAAEPVTIFRRRRFPVLIPVAGTLLLGLLVLAIIRPWSAPSPLGLGTLKRTEGPGHVASKKERAEPSAVPVLSPHEERTLRTRPAQEEAASPPRAAGPSEPVSRRPSAAGGQALKSLLFPEQEEAGEKEVSEPPAVSVGRETLEEEQEEGLWRLWLLSLGPRPEELRQILIEEGLLAEGHEALVLELPVLLKEGTSREAASNLAARLEEAGGRVRLEFVPR
ncbi:MAG: zf-HC2 domain-containing protein [Bacillota bacterium]